jgi:hypothetical protein
LFDRAGELEALVDAGRERGASAGPPRPLVGRLALVRTLEDAMNPVKPEENQ